MPERRFSYLELALLAIAFVCYGAQVIGSIFDLYAGTGASGVPYVTVKSDGRVFVSGIREGSDESGGLQVGDEILQVGGTQQLPQSQIAWRHNIVHADGKVRIRQDGEVLQVHYSVTYFGFPAAVLIKDLFYGALAISLLFAPAGLLRTVTAAAALFWISIGEGAPIGPTATATLWLAIANWVSQAMLWPLIINFAQVINNPKIPAGRLVPAWIFASAGLALMFVYTGGPLPPSQHFAIYLALPLLAEIVTVGLLIRNFRRSTGKLRRQYNWIATSIFVNGIAVAVLFVTSAVLGDFQIYLLGVEFTSVVIIAGVTMAVLRADFAGIDKADPVGNPGSHRCRVRAALRIRTGAVGRAYDPHAWTVGIHRTNFAYRAGGVDRAFIETSDSAVGGSGFAGKWKNYRLKQIRDAPERRY